PDCPICLQSLEDQGRHCVCPCGTSFHGTCVATYVTSQAEQGGVVKCPSCASIWPEEVYSPCLGDQPELQQRFERAKKSQEELLSRRADVQADGTSELSPRTKEALARLGIRPCPQCRVMIQKQADGLFTGCDKMTCRCGCMFCFRCGSEARAGGVARCRCVGPQHSYIPRSAVLSNYEGAWVFPSALDVDLTKRPKGRSKTTSARLQRESKALAKDPPPLIRIAHEAGQLRWHFIMEGPLESAFEGGRYWGNLDMPQDYPFQPPLVRFRTPTGRFKVDTWLCRTQLDYHPEGWQPSWTLSGFLLALLALLCGLDDGVIDALGGRSHRAYTWILHMQHACWF
ncbi:unnamed protein product, partial [Durusdinium trenchii]